jgi:hypothetical protein
MGLFYVVFSQREKVSFSSLRRCVLFIVMTIAAKVAASSVIVVAASALLLLIRLTAIAELIVILAFTAEAATTTLATVHRLLELIALGWSERAIRLTAAEVTTASILLLFTWWAELAVRLGLAEVSTVLGAEIAAVVARTRSAELSTIAALAVAWLTLWLLVVEATVAELVLVAGLTAWLLEVLLIVLAVLVVAWTVCAGTLLLRTVSVHVLAFDWCTIALCAWLALTSLITALLDQFTIGAQCQTADLVSQLLAATFTTGLLGAACGTARTILVANTSTTLSL